MDLIKEELINKINNADLDTLLAMKAVFEKPQAEIFEVFSAEKLKDKELRKWEIKIAKDLLKFMKSVYKNSKKNPNISEDQRLTFSSDDADIKQILDKSDIIKKIWLRARINNLNDMDLQIWIEWFWARKLSINEDDNLVLKWDRLRH